MTKQFEATGGNYTTFKPDEVPKNAVIVGGDIDGSEITGHLVRIPNIIKDKNPGFCAKCPKAEGCDVTDLPVCFGRLTTASMVFAEQRDTANARRDEIERMADQEASASGKYACVLGLAIDVLSQRLQDEYSNACSTALGASFDLLHVKDRIPHVKAAIDQGTPLPKQLPQPSK
jgi:hypothetical protein